jgi:uncharacterized membrane protein
MTMDREGSQLLAHWVHWTLLAGVSLNGILLVMGLVLFFWHGPANHAHASVSIPQAIEWKNIEDGTSLMQLGLLILIATPMVRVLVLALGWSFSKKTRFAVVAWTVLVLLMVGILMGMSQ